MKIRIYPDEEINLYRILRGLGYHPHQSARRGTSYTKSIRSGDYPRFHIYTKETDKYLDLLLHMDMKKPSYPGSHAHNAEYDGDRVEKEARRILSGLQAEGLEVDIKT